MTDEEPPASRWSILVSALGRTLQAALLLGWMVAGAWFILGIAEFAAAVDGIGYGHMSEPSRVSYLAAAGLALLAGWVVWAVDRGRMSRATGILIGPAFWVVTMFVAAGSLGWHYDEVCDTRFAPRACIAGSWRNPGTCVPGQDEACHGRLERSCRLGYPQACERLLAIGSWSSERSCAALEHACSRSIECASSERPASCDEPTAARFETPKMTYMRACETHERLCRPGRSDH